MLNIWQAALLGSLQGASELFPISSLGHSVIVPQLLHWQLDQSSDAFVSFIVATHLATAIVLLSFFWKDWLNITLGMLRSLKAREISVEDTDARTGWLLVVATVPAGILGLLFEQTLKQLFASGLIVAAALFLNGVVLFTAGRLRHHADTIARDDKEVAALPWSRAILIGIMQCGALIPGFSRTGLTMTGGLMSNLSHENAARFSFLLATPIIFAASVLKLPALFIAGGSALDSAMVGALFAAITAYFAVRFLLKYFETRTLTPFAIYCVAAGALSFIALQQLL